MSRKNRKKSPITMVIIVVFSILLSMGSAFTWIHSQTLPVSRDSQENSYFIVRRGETVDQIGRKLKEDGLIRSQPVFKFIVMKEGLATKIQAGSFQLSQSMDVAQIAKSLTQGRQDVWVTIIEGQRREEITSSLAISFFEQGIDFDEDLFLRVTKGKEGMLFPDTYLFPISVTEENVASMLTNTFNKKITDKMRSDIAKKGTTLDRIITKASLIEREARTYKSRKMVSGIIDNRLEVGMALQIDATMQYTKGYSKIHGDWWAPPLAVDKEIDSPYNTYQVIGLPPGPICSPSIDSINAAIYPTPSDYIYYITDNQGAMHYATTLQQHNQNVQTYLR